MLKKIQPGWWFHGHEDESLDLRLGAFFSSRFEEACPHGPVMFCAWIGGLEAFDTLDGDSVSEFMAGNPITDPYDGTEYATAEEFMEACGHDTWEAFEDIGLPASSIVYEGGVKNLYVKPYDAGKVRLHRMPDGPLYFLALDGRDPVGEPGLILHETPPGKAEGSTLWMTAPGPYPMTPDPGGQGQWILVEESALAAVPALSEQTRPRP